MPFSNLQKLRKARARNKGGTRRLASVFREMAKMLEKKLAEDFSRTEITSLQTTRKMITGLLHMNALTKSMQGLLDGKIQKVGGKYTASLDPKDL
jgi:hypothetical protein